MELLIGTVWLTVIGWALMFVVVPHWRSLLRGSIAAGMMVLLWLMSMGWGGDVWRWMWL